MRSEPRLAREAPAIAPPTLEHARELLRRRFGYDEFRPGQERAVSAVLAQRDTLVILPTGGGKSLCYQVPALLLPRLTVVVSPLISLMKDQVDALTRRGLPATFVNSTLTTGEVSDRLARTERGEFKLLYVAPERFDFGVTAERLRAIGVSLLAIDEAHCISEWGHDFRPSYLRIRDVRARLGAPPVVALTATATPEVRRDIVRQLELTDPETVISGFDRKNLHYHVIRTRTEQDKDRALVDTLTRWPGLAVVYASTRRAVERITAILERARIDAVAYHAGLDDEHRRDVQDAFMHERVRVIVATNAFGMGIDKANVRLVVHHAMPGTLEAYYQEAGRAGRDGESSECVLLHAFQDRFTHEFFIKSAYPERPVVERVFAEVRHAADAAGLARLTPTDIAAATHGEIKDREAESALRILAHAGAIQLDNGNGARLWVRLLATPERIRAELGASDRVERDLLRALWRGVGARLQSGAAIDPEGLPPGFGGSTGVAAILERLQARQFVVWERSGAGIRLTDPAAPLSRFPVDWATLDRRRTGDMAKLDAVQRYAYTKSCRRAFVLRYFGDPAARATCEGCDICLGTHVHVESGAGRDARRGDRASRAGRASDASAADGSVPRTAPRAGSATGSRNGSYRQPRNGSPPAAVDNAAPKAAKAAPMDLPELTGADVALVGALRSLRTTIARDEKLPAYCVFADRTLVEMAVRRPHSLAALATVRGVGPTKLDRYGERFLALIRGANDTEAA